MDHWLSICRIKADSVYKSRCPLRGRGGGGKGTYVVQFCAFFLEICITPIHKGPRLNNRLQKDSLRGLESYEHHMVATALTKF